MSIINPGAQVTRDERTWAALANLLGLVSSVLGPFIVWLLKRRQSPFVTFHAVQQILLQIVVALLLGIIHNVIRPTAIEILLDALVGTANALACLFAAYAGHHGRRWEMPGIGPIAARYDSV